MESSTLLNNRYRLLTQIAAGGMAVVYKAQDTLLNRVVAIKVLRESFAADPTFQARFQREAEAAANLNHANIVTVYDVGHDAGRYYIVMEFVDGEDLKSVIRAEAPLTIRRAVDIAVQICAALGAAHRANLVHCDVKPQNVLVTNDGRVKVTDFGIARVLSQASSHITDTVWGTPHYISPEQATGESPTPASDVYAVGVILYEMLAGRLPFEGETHTQLALAHIRDEPPPLTSLNPAVPAQIDQIVRKVMSKEPAARYRNADQLATILIEYRHAADQTTGYQPALHAPTHTAPGSLPAHASGGAGVGQTAVRAPISIEESAAQPEGFDWLGWLLGGLAAIALIGLIPLWLLVARAYSAPTLTPTPTADNTPPPDSTSPLGNDLISVPNLVGLTRDQAVARLTEIGLGVVEGTPRFDKNAPIGAVIEQMPAAGTASPRNTVVQIIVSNGPQVSTVINVLGAVLDKTIEDGLKSYGWDIRLEEIYSQEPFHKILNQFPQPGAQLAAGDPLTLTVSGGVTLTLNVQFGEMLQLDNVLLPEDELRPGDSIDVTFLWRALRRSSQPYVRFIHFVDADGNIRSQEDGEPSPPTPTWGRNVVMRDQFFLPIPPDAPPGEYRLYVGFYPVGSPFTRLPINDAGESEEIADDRALVKTITILP
jgi:serine/threonine-protein kinase